MIYSINLEPDQDTLDGRNLDRMISAYLDYCAARLPARTIANYRARLAIFLEWWSGVGPWRGWQLTEDLMRQFDRWLAVLVCQRNRRPYSWHSRNDVVRRLRQCFAWGYQRGYLPKDFGHWLQPPEGGPPLRERATLDDLRRLMDAAGQSANPVRDQALLALFIGTGVRRQEAVAIDVADVRMHADKSGTAAVRHAKRVKGRQIQGRVIGFDGWTGMFLERLLETYPPGDGPLFRRGETDPSQEPHARLSDQAAYRAVKRAVKRAGLTDLTIKGPHDLRRAFATWSAVEGIDRGVLYGRLLSKQLGHSNVAMTDRYIWHDAEDLRANMRSPLADD